MLIAALLASAHAAAAGAGTAAGAELPVQRHVGRWSQTLGRSCPTTYQIPGSPVIGNGDVGVSFCGAANHTTFFLAANSFWAPNVAVDARPSALAAVKPGMGAPPGGAESYVTARIGDISLLVPALSASKYDASQDLYHATANATFGGRDCDLTHSSVVTAEDNMLITKVTVHGHGCGRASHGP